MKCLESLSFEGLETFSFADYENMARELWTIFVRWQQKNEDVILSTYRHFSEMADSTCKQKPADLLLNQAFRLLGNKDFFFILRESRNMFRYPDVINDYMNLRELGPWEPSEKSFNCFPLAAQQAMKMRFPGRKNNRGKKNAHLFYLRTFIWLLNEARFRQDVFSGLEKFLQNDSDFHAAFGEAIIALSESGGLELDGHTVENCLLFLRENCALLLQALPHDKSGHRGFAKAVKVMLGVLGHTLINIPRNSSRLDINETVCRAIKIGYYWGVTYPLLDDFIDSQKYCDKNTKIYLDEALTSLFKNMPLRNSTHAKLSVIPQTRELLRCINKLMTMVPYEDNKHTYQLISIAHRAQMRNSTLNLHRQHETQGVYSSIIMKAAMVRIATAAIAGVPITPDFVRRVFVMAVYNQLEDDFQDFSEDEKMRIATPFTLYANLNIDANPICTFFEYGAFVWFLSGFRPHVLRALSAQNLCVIKELINNNNKKWYFSRFLPLFLRQEEACPSPCSVSFREKLILIGKRHDGIPYVDYDTLATFVIERSVDLFRRRGLEENQP